ncbi:MAG TPA: DUF885 domain-containing protein [Longimicrobiales bacterium]|nr:DUF885 domain-containing protein [Longimicrobiales bacterium]
MRARVLVVISAVLITACGAPPPQPRDPRDDLADAPRPTADHVRRIAAEFDALETAFLDWYYETYPVRASVLGIQEHDRSLPAFDRVAVQRRIDDLLDWVAELNRVPLTLLDDPDRYDYAVLEFALQAELLDLEEIRPWANDPRLYTQIIGDGIASLASRAYAPAAERSAAVAARMRDAGPLLEAARANLRRPPRLWTELAISDTRGLIQYLQEGLPAALASQGGDSAAGAAVATEAERLVGALGAHADWLENDLLPRSDGDFRLGRYLFQRKVLYEEHINISVEDLDRLNNEKIAEYQDSVARIAGLIDPGRPPREVMDSITRMHPAPSDLLPTARELMLEARQWVRDAELVTIPTEEIPEVAETPPYARGGFASMDAPGPFAPAGQQAYFYITNVDPDWSEEDQRQHLSYFNYPGLLGVTVHETFPGHFVHLAYAREVDSRIRKTFMPRSLTEGWAHYAEHLVVEQGFRSGDPAVRLGQLRRALQRHARWYAGLHLHAFGATIEEVVPRYMEIANFDEFPARREVTRATYDPTYLYYALGRMQILELRDDYREHKEEEREEYSLREFHDRLLELALPLTLARQALLNPPIGPRLQPTSPRRRP